MKLEELLPGHQSCPTHYHLLEEEHLLILEGEALLRWGDEEYVLKAGAYICFRAGEQHAHCLVNRSVVPCRYIIIGERKRDDVVVYPDSKKVLVRALDEVYERRPVAYWQDEDEKAT